MNVACSPTAQSTQQTCQQNQHTRELISAQRRNTNTATKTRVAYGNSHLACESIQCVCYIYISSTRGTFACSQNSAVHSSYGRFALVVSKCTKPPNKPYCISSAEKKQLAEFCLPQTKCCQLFELFDKQTERGSCFTEWTNDVSHWTLILPTSHSESCGDPPQPFVCFVHIDSLHQQAAAILQQLKSPAHCGLLYKS